MKIPTVAGTMSLSGEPPRSTAYYYADLERLKRKNNQEPIQETSQNQDELSEYVEANEVVNEGGIREIPPFRDRRQFSLPEYNGPDTARKDTYSTAGTFPMREPKEKEPLLAELEVVGRLPLSQLDSSVGVRRSRSWYLCCPNIGDEEISRESSWRYSSLRPVTAPPITGQNGINVLVATEGSGREDLSTIRAERDALARALAAERQRAATAARAHDARLAELHGVIAELVRRRAQDKHAGAIPEEEVSDECESTTQPAGELDNDADRSRTEQNDTSSAPSPAELPTPQESKVEPQELPEDTSDTTTQDIDIREVQPSLAVTSPVTQPAIDTCDASLNLSEKDSEVCLTTARCGVVAGDSAGDSCSRQHSPASGLYTHSTGRCESRQAKVASRVRLKKTEDSDSNNHLSNEEAWCTEAAERLALDVCAQADLREALVAASNDGSSPVAWRARCARLEAQLRVLQCALARATDTAHRLYSACAVQESTSVALCCALRAADRALETYDVLLALAETQHADNPERESAELVARQLLARLEMEQTSAAIGEPLLSPGPWLQHHNHSNCSTASGWSARSEAALRAHAARLKADTAALRMHARPELFSFHDVDEEEISKSVKFSMSDMEAAVALEEVLVAAEMKANRDVHKSGPPSNRRRRERHWLESQASETDL